MDSCTLTRKKLLSVTMQTLAPTLSANTFLVWENSVFIFVFLNVTHTMCTHNVHTHTKINTQKRLTYSLSLIHLQKYAYLLTKSLLQATCLLVNVLLLQSQHRVLTVI